MTATSLEQAAGRKRKRELQHKESTTVSLDEFQTLAQSETRAVKILRVLVVLFLLFLSITVCAGV
jgi:ABC-type Na+ efflux pump permease subunit